MKKTYSIAAFTVALVLVCAVVALEWYARVGAPRSGAPIPVQAVTAAPTVMPVPSPSQRPVVYIPVQQTSASASASPSPAPRGSGEAVIPSTSAPATQSPLSAGATIAPQSLSGPLATVAPSIVLPPVVRQPPDAPPRILAMLLSSPVVYGGEVVSGVVETSSNVASVEARIGGYSSTLQKVGVGRFQMSYRVPRLPFFLHHTYSIEVIARNTKGQVVTSSVPITVR